MHYLDHKKSGMDCFMAVKLDMSKTYDWVEWEFVERVMRRLGFHDKWVRWILKCIKTVTYFILINGKAHGIIAPTKGLWQGDSLSSYLFLLCTEALSALIANANNNRSLNGVSICRGYQRSSICSSQMIACCFARQRGRNVPSWWKSLNSMS